MTRQYRHEELAAMPDRKLWDLMAAYRFLSEDTHHEVTRVICKDMRETIKMILSRRSA